MRNAIYWRPRELHSGLKGIVISWLTFRRAGGDLERRGRGKEKKWKTKLKVRNVKTRKRGLRVERREK